MIDQLIGSQSIIITLDVDALLYDRLEQVNKTDFKVVEINCADHTLLSKIIIDFPSLRIGAGNVIDTNQFESCYKAGVNFVTSPGFMPAIAQTANVYSVNYLPGIATLSEAMQAMAIGCHHVRPYPANYQLCNLLNKCLPLLRLFPADIGWEDVERFLRLPSVAGVSVLNPDTLQLSDLSSSFKTTGVLA